MHFEVKDILKINLDSPLFFKAILKKHTEGCPHKSPFHFWMSGTLCVCILH